MNMSPLDRLICEVDAGLRTLFATSYAERSLPEPAVAPSLTGNVPQSELSIAEKRESARLMRINHVGEVCAQALYQGQAMMARTPQIHALLIHAAREEKDHLAWCQTRITELNGATSRLTPLFYAGSFALGAVSGLLGDKWSMGFLVETERQVEAHLSEHLKRLPENDQRSRQIIETMRADEIHHAQTGLENGGVALPPPVKAAMRGVSKVMTASSYWL